MNSIWLNSERSSLLSQIEINNTNLILIDNIMNNNENNNSNNEVKEHDVKVFWYAILCICMNILVSYTTFTLFVTFTIGQSRETGAIHYLQWLFLDSSEEE